MLKNKTRNTTISKEERVLEKIYEIGTGLMFRRRLKENQAYFFQMPETKKWDVTMLFVFQSIDLIFCLDNKVVELKENIRPFQYYNCKKNCNQLIEAPPGTIKRTKTQVGDITIFKKT